MNTCKHCGTLLDDDALFCTSCGTMVEIIPKHKCPSCGTELDNDSVFCTGCGTRIGQIPSTVSAPNPQPQANEPTPSYFEDDSEEQERRKQYIIIGSIVAAILICILSWFAYQKFSGNSETINAEEVEEYAPLSATFRGAIDKYPITMEIEFDGSNVSGTYYYNRQGPDKRLTLIGVIKDYHLELFESDENGRQTGHFQGIQTNGEYEGEFINMQGKRMHFKLIESNE